ncbi:uncharacterized protein [Salminus brasiliensis]|uniref:uncharacterized protein isoform X1 n=2 Tax=Salminus brasiliensis TaxID=930266 RepID=UPI003B82EEC1
MLLSFSFLMEVNVIRFGTFLFYWSSHHETVTHYKSQYGYYTNIALSLFLRLNMYQVSATNLPVIFTEAIIGSLKEGLVSINEVYEALIESEVDAFSGQCTNYVHIREQIVRAEQSLDRSEEEASAGLQSLDENIEALTRDEGNFEQEMRATQQTLDNLRTEQTSKEALLKQSEGALEVARSTLSSTRDTLRAQEERKRNAEIVTGVGAGLLVIPIVGWIAGSVMIASGAAELDQSARAVRAAEEEVRSFETEVEMFQNKVSDYRWRISRTEDDIRQKRDRMEQIRTEIRRVKEQRASVADLQEKVRGAVHILSVLSGKADVVEVQTRRFILLEPVMKVMEDVMKSAGDIGGSQLLFDEGLPRLLDRMRENNRKLAAICDSFNDAEDEGY